MPSEMLSAKDVLMPHHMSNVANWCIKIANELEFDDKDIKILPCKEVMSSMVLRCKTGNNVKVVTHYPLLKKRYIQDCYSMNLRKK